MKLPHSPAGLAHLVQEFDRHLTQQAGLAPQTCAQRVRYVSRFLKACCPDPRSRLSLQQLNAAGLQHYVLQLSGCCRAHTLRCHMGAVRSFLRFLALTGRIPSGLEQALPLIRASRNTIAHCLNRLQLRGLLSAFDDHQSAGVRDYAMALLAARLGLRAKEIAQLCLEDVNWQAGTLELHQTKGRRSRLLPLPAPVGQALAKYLRTVRPYSGARQVFLCLYQPRPLTAGAVSDAVAAAFSRAGLKVPRPGTHLLRHTLATHLVEQGASLKAVADVLGHRSLNTTTIYTQVNLTMLARIAQPWPGEGR